MTLSDSVRDYTRMVELLKDIERMEKKLSDNVFPLREALNQAMSLPILTDDLKTHFDDLLKQTNNQIDRISAPFGRELASAFADKQLPFKGQYPQFDSGLFQIHLDKQQGRALIWYGPRQEKLAEVNHDVNAIVKALEQAPRQIESKFDGHKLAELMSQTFKEYGRKRYGIIHFMMLLTLEQSRRDRKFRENPLPQNAFKYERFQFSYDLYRFRDSLRTVIALKTATRMSTERKRNLSLDTS